MNNFGKRQGVKIEGPFYKYSEKLASLKTPDIYYVEGEKKLDEDVYKK